MQTTYSSVLDRHKTFTEPSKKLVTIVTKTSLFLGMFQASEDRKSKGAKGF